MVMARFARDCLEKMNELARKLEVTLGPDTANLAMRAGVHSGPVTAGVLRGDRARFQLFGDTGMCKGMGRRKTYCLLQQRELTVSAAFAFQSTRRLVWRVQEQNERSRFLKRLLN